LGEEQLPEAKEKCGVYSLYNNIKYLGDTLINATFSKARPSVLPIVFQREPQAKR